MTWTSEKDEALCKEILLLEPFIDFGQGQKRV